MTITPHPTTSTAPTSHPNLDGEDVTNTNTNRSIHPQNTTQYNDKQNRQEIKDFLNLIIRDHLKQNSYTSTLETFTKESLRRGAPAHNSWYSIAEKIGLATILRNKSLRNEPNIDSFSTTSNSPLSILEIILMELMHEENMKVRQPATVNKITLPNPTLTHSMTQSAYSSTANHIQLTSDINNTSNHHHSIDNHHHHDNTIENDQKLEEEENKESHVGSIKNAIQIKNRKNNKTKKQKGKILPRRAPAVQKLQQPKIGPFTPKQNMVSGSGGVGSEKKNKHKKRVNDKSQVEFQNHNSNIPILDAGVNDTLESPRSPTYSQNPESNNPLSPKSTTRSPSMNRNVKENLFNHKKDLPQLIKRRYPEHIRPSTCLPERSSNTSKEFRIPDDIRNKIFMRNLTLLKHNIKGKRTVEEQAVRRIKYEHVTELDHNKFEEELKSKSQQKCALCEVKFSLCNLKVAVPFKTIVDMRKAWMQKNNGAQKGLKFKINEALLHPAVAYDQVRICLFCTQLMDEQDKYRPPIEKLLQEERERKLKSREAKEALWWDPLKVLTQEKESFMKDLEEQVKRQKAAAKTSISAG